PRSPFRPGTLTWQARLLAFEQAWCSRAKRSVQHLVSVATIKAKSKMLKNVAIKNVSVQIYNFSLF
ncbi:hypothetical protein, partial [Ligilactobacillus ruminis]|uniref:hypothetical protein n=1 Tax=Ligilactobacillus ruminis TaxID=1623 RepID=UPI001E44E988